MWFLNLQDWNWGNFTTNAPVPKVKSTTIAKTKHPTQVRLACFVVIFMVETWWIFSTKILRLKPGSQILESQNQGRGNMRQAAKELHAITTSDMDLPTYLPTYCTTSSVTRLATSLRLYWPSQQQSFVPKVQISVYAWVRGLVGEQAGKGLAEAADGLGFGLVVHWVSSQCLREGVCKRLRLAER